MPPKRGGGKKYPPGSVLGATRSRIQRQKKDSSEPTKCHKPWSQSQRVAGPMRSNAARFPKDLDPDDRDFANLPQPDAPYGKWGHTPRFKDADKQGAHAYLDPDYDTKSKLERDQGRTTSQFKDSAAKSRIDDDHQDGSSFMPTHKEWCESKPFDGPMASRARRFSGEQETDERDFPDIQPEREHDWNGKWRDTPRDHKDKQSGAHAYLDPDYDTKSKLERDQGRTTSQFKDSAAKSRIDDDHQDGSSFMPTHKEWCESKPFDGPMASRTRRFSGEQETDERDFPDIQPEREHDWDGRWRDTPRDQKDKQSGAHAYLDPDYDTKSKLERDQGRTTSQFKDSAAKSRIDDDHQDGSSFMPTHKEWCESKPFDGPMASRTRRFSGEQETDERDFPDIQPEREHDWNGKWRDTPRDHKDKQSGAHAYLDPDYDTKSKLERDQGRTTSQFKDSAAKSRIDDDHQDGSSFMPTHKEWCESKPFDGPMASRARRFSGEQETDERDFPDIQPEREHDWNGKWRDTPRDHKDKQSGAHAYLDPDYDTKSKLERDQGRTTSQFKDSAAKSRIDDDHQDGSSFMPTHKEWCESKPFDGPMASRARRFSGEQEMDERDFPDIQPEREHDWNGKWRDTPRDQKDKQSGAHAYLDPDYDTKSKLERDQGRTTSQFKDSAAKSRIDDDHQDGSSFMPTHKEWCESKPFDGPMASRARRFSGEQETDERDFPDIQPEREHDWDGRWRDTPRDQKDKQSGAHAYLDPDYDTKSKLERDQGRTTSQFKDSAAKSRIDDDHQDGSSFMPTHKEWCESKPFDGPMASRARRFSGEQETDERDFPDIQPEREHDWNGKWRDTPRDHKDKQSGAHAYLDPDYDTKSKLERDQGRTTSQFKDSAAKSRIDDDHQDGSSFMPTHKEWCESKPFDGPMASRTRRFSGEQETDERDFPDIQPEREHDWDGRWRDTPRDQKDKQSGAHAYLDPDYDTKSKLERDQGRTTSQFKDSAAKSRIDDDHQDGSSFMPTHKEWCESKPFDGPMASRTRRFSGEQETDERDFPDIQPEREHDWDGRWRDTPRDQKDKQSGAHAYLDPDYDTKSKLERDQGRTTSQFKDSAAKSRIDDDHQDGSSFMPTHKEWCEPNPNGGMMSSREDRFGNDDLPKDVTPDAGFYDPSSLDSKKGLAKTTADRFKYKEYDGADYVSPHEEAITGGRIMYVTNSMTILIK